jgi:hypothetical protein
MLLCYVIFVMLYYVIECYVLCYVIGDHMIRYRACVNKWQMTSYNDMTCYM